MQAPKSNTKDFEQCPTGWGLGVCTRVIDIGTHWQQDKFDPSKGKFQRKAAVVFESQHLMKEGDFIGEPFLLYANFNYSMYQGKAHLCTFIENWRGKRFSGQDEADIFDLAKLIGQKSFMNVIRSECGKFTNIQTIGPVPEGMVAPEIKGKTILIDQDNLNPAEVEKLSDKMRERVLSAEERKPENQAQTKENFQAPASQATGIMSENPGAGLTPSDGYGFNDPLPDLDSDIPF